MSDDAHVERALFVVAGQNGGKSTYLRSMFRDHHFGHGGAFHDTRGRVPIVHLSNERSLLVHLSSPHEKNESVDEYLERIATRTRSGRCNFAGALQPQSRTDLPGPATYIERFDPERVRICLLSPDRNGDEHDLQALRAALHPHQTEPIVIDGSVNVKSGDPERYDLFLADFFAFA